MVSERSEVIWDLTKARVLTASTFILLFTRRKMSAYPKVYKMTHELKVLPDPVKVSSAPSPVVVVVSLLFKGSVLTARRDTM